MSGGEDHLRRLFVAVPLAPESCAAVSGIVGRVREEMAGAGREVRWVRLDGLHVTLRFLGATAEERIPGIETALRGAASGVSPFLVTIAGAGAFPPVGRPRVLWLGIEGGAGRLAGLAAAIDEGLAADEWDRETRPFRAHLTLARADGVPTGQRTVAALRRAAEGFTTSWQAASVT
ncbi:MAG TPA: RNA 2',3'-cyclic phosphodiesterase, partial [Candidatus Dormibacteraeota bacterium]|nr:RNA 2',3'-cyclic phosphodiesterase [Candidatus Dormibacteraeota bacterium]